MPSLPTVWITGAGGLIGNYLVQTAPRFAPQFQPLGLTRALDLTDFAAVRRTFADQRPQLVIHCAAMSRSPECQAKPDLARRVNVDATALLAELTADLPFVFFSTDLVYDGEKGNYVETDAVNPISVYGETKVACEALLRAHKNCLILRCAINAGKSATGDRGFNEAMRLAWQGGGMFRLFTDEYRCPIPAPVTAQATWELVAKKVTGTFHLSGTEKLSRHDIGRILTAHRPDWAAQIVPCSRKEYPGAPRPGDVSLDCRKVQAHLSFPLPKFSDWCKKNPGEVL